MRVRGSGRIWHITVASPRQSEAISEHRALREFIFVRYIVLFTTFFMVPRRVE